MKASVVKAVLRHGKTPGRDMPEEKSTAGRLLPYSTV
jgi:hypothetical protein